VKKLKEKRVLFMKKIVSFLLAVTLLCGLLSITAGAAADPLAVKFRDQLGLLDHFYDYNRDYMVRIASDYFVDWDNMGPVTVSAAEYEEKLHKHFVLSDAQLESIRQYDVGDGRIYDADTQTYTIQWYGGFGGMLQERDYLGYVKNGETYDVYYHHIAYSFLADVLPEGMEEYEYAESLGYPMEIEYNGVTYESGMDGYFAIVGYDDYGRKYTVEMNGDTVRIISVADYTAGQAPDEFDDVISKVEYDIPADDSVAIPENDCFEGDTVVKVEKITAGTSMNTAKEAMKTVAEKYVAFEFTAKKDGATVQPNGALAVTFAIPAGYSTNVKVYYMAKNGTLENVKATVNAADRTVTAQLSHFSTYILADADSKPVTPPTTQPTQPSIQPTTQPATQPTTEPVTTPSTAEPTTPSTQPNNSGNQSEPANFGLIIAVVIVAAVIFGTAAFLVIRKAKK
jgi:hypothetical protein